jgi:hypothetical protein
MSESFPVFLFCVVTHFFVFQAPTLTFIRMKAPTKWWVSSSVSLPTSILHPSIYPQLVLQPSDDKELTRSPSSPLDQPPQDIPAFRAAPSQRSLFPAPSADPSDSQWQDIDSKLQFLR